MPVPMTAMVEPQSPPLARNAPTWDAASMPSAMPDTTVTPRSAKACANASAVSEPPCEQLREPTIAMARRLSNSMRPLA